MKNLEVCHRSDGLEVITFYALWLDGVCHRSDGLEVFGGCV